MNLLEVEVLLSYKKKNVSINCCAMKDRKLGGYYIRKGGETD